MKALMVTTAFYPEQAIGSVRMCGIAKYSLRNGRNISIISLTPPTWARKDESLYFEGLNDADWTQLPQSRLFSICFGRFRKALVGEKSALTVVRQKGPSLVSRIRGRLVGFAQFAYTLLKGLDWAVVVVRHAKKKGLAGFDVAITSYPSFASPLAGIFLKKTGVVNAVHVDFRDPIIYGRPGMFSFSGAIQKYILRNADMVTGVSKGVLNKVRAEAQRQLPKLVVPNGFDEDLSSAGSSVFPKPSIISFCYVGSMYGGQRDLSLLFDAMARAIVSEQSIRLEIHYAGSDWHIFRQQCISHLPEDSIINHGYVSRDEAMLLQKSSDVCLLSTWNTSDDQGILTGKMFEFFMYRKPILAVVNGDLAYSETKEVMGEVGAGFCLEEANSDDGAKAEIDSWLRSIVREKITYGAVRSHYNANVNKYSLSVLVDKFFDFQESVLEGNA